jgi:hypothetical protein
MERIEALDILVLSLASTLDVASASDISQALKYAGQERYAIILCYSLSSKREGASLHEANSADVTLKGAEKV